MVSVVVGAVFVEIGTVVSTIVVATEGAELLSATVVVEVAVSTCEA